MRKIIHVDMDAFFASVEQRDNPDLQGKPVVVGGNPNSRGVVAACSYEAREFGVHSAMPSSKAYKLCPKAIFVKPRFEAYLETSQKVRAVFAEITDKIEPLSLDEAYLDVTDSDLFQGSATLIANHIRQRIYDEVNLTASAGVSYNKFLAKVASDMNKPNGLYLIEPEHAEEFMEQLEVRKFFGVGKVTEKKLHSHGIYTGKDLKHYTELELTNLFGKSGRHYYNIVRGVDNRPVSSSRVRKSIGKETTFSEDLVDKRQIWETLKALSEKVSSSLLSKDIMAKTLTLKVKYNDFKQITRSKTLADGLQTQQQIIDVLPELLAKTDVGEKPVRLLGLNMSSLLDLSVNNSGSETKSTLDSQQDSQHDSQQSSKQLPLL